MKNNREYIILLSLLCMLLSIGKVEAQDNEIELWMKSFSSKDTTAIVSAINRLGELRSFKSIPSIIEYLDLFYIDESYGGMVWNVAEVYEDCCFPALRVLLKFGEWNETFLFYSLTRAISNKDRTQRFLINASHLILRFTNADKFRQKLWENHMEDLSSVQRKRALAFVDFFYTNPLLNPKDEALIDSLIPILADTTSTNRNSLALNLAIQKIKEVDRFTASRISYYLVPYLDLDLYVVDTIAYLKMKEASSFLPYEYLFPTIEACQHIGEPALPFILQYISEHEISKRYKLNAMSIINKVMGSNRAAKSFSLVFAEDFNAKQRKKIVDFVNFFPD